MNDNEIIKALKESLEIMLCEGDLQRSATISKSLDLINSLQAENEKNENIIRLADKTIETANAEIERLKNAYKQCAWERDVFAEDMTNLVNILLRLMFYLTGIFYSLDSINNVVYRSILLDLNPMANLIYNMRNVLMYGSGPVGMWTLLWFFIGLGLCALGIRTIYKYENTYVKVMR